MRPKETRKPARGGGVEGKFMSNAAPIIGFKQGEELADMILHLKA